MMRSRELVEASSPCDVVRHLATADAPPCESPDLLRFALDAARIGTWERDLSTGALEASALCKANLGLAADAPLSFDDLQAMRHPDDAERVTKAIETAIASHGEYDVRYRVVRPDGTTGWIAAKGYAVYDGGKPIRMVGITV